MSKDEQRHNGWTNYPTWLVNVWLTNDEGTFNELTDKAKEAWELRHDGLYPELQTPRQHAAHLLSEGLKEWVEEMAPDLGSTLWADLLTSALSDVDWRELAENALSDTSEFPDDAAEKEGV